MIFFGIHSKCIESCDFRACIMCAHTHTHAFLYVAFVITLSVQNLQWLVSFAFNYWYCLHFHNISMQSPTIANVMHIQRIVHLSSVLWSGFLFEFPYNDFVFIENFYENLITAPATQYSSCVQIHIRAHTQAYTNFK